MSSNIPEHNQVHLNRRFLIQVLDDLSERLYHRFGRVVRLVVHGGAVMVLHKRLLCRQFTRDVDYLHRSFEVEWKQRGVLDAGDRLNFCISETASVFGLGLDWMNAHADVALPMALDNRGRLYDPIHTDAMQAHNMQLNTIYHSRGLQLIGVSWSWAVALKLVRYKKDDPQDIAAILKLGTQFKGLQWTRRIMEEWILSMCSPMGYTHYSQEQIVATRQKMQDAIQRAQALTWPSQVPQSLPAMPPTMPERPTTTHPIVDSVASHEQSRSLRARTRSLSHLAPRPAHSLSAASSMPNIMPQPVRQVTAAIPGPPTSLHVHAPQGSFGPVTVTQLPAGFVPYGYYITPPPHQSLHHRLPAPPRIRV